MENRIPGGKTWMGIWSALNVEKFKRKRPRRSGERIVNQGEWALTIRGKFNTTDLILLESLHLLLAILHYFQNKKQLFLSRRFPKNPT